MLSKDAVQQESDYRNRRYQQEQQAADEECCLPAGFLGRLGDAEGVDEGVGQEVEQGHTSLCANVAALQGGRLCVHRSAAGHIL